MKFEFTKTEADYIIENAGFTDEEKEVFLLRRRGKSIIYISMELNQSKSTIDRRIANIKRKIKRVL